MERLGIMAMRFSLLNHLRSSRSWNVGSTVTRDADELVRLWGSAAYERATDLSWREDSGLVQSPRPGHWWSVRRELERRLGREQAEPRAEFAA